MEGHIAEIESRLSEDFQLSHRTIDFITGEQSKSKITKASWISEMKEFEGVIDKTNDNILYW